MVMVVLKGGISAAAQQCDAHGIQPSALTQRAGRGFYPEVVVTVPDTMLPHIEQWYLESRIDEPPFPDGAILYYSPL